MITTLDHARAAQEAAEARLEAGELVLTYEGEFDGSEEIPQETYEAAAGQMAGPFCGCNTCIVREILSAAWPHLRDHAIDLFLTGLGQSEFREKLLRALATTRD